MAFGDKTITFDQEEVNFVQSVIEEFRQSAEGQASSTTEDVVASVLSKLANTPSALS